MSATTPILIRIISFLFSFVSLFNCTFLADVGCNYTTQNNDIKVMTFNLRQFKIDLFSEHTSVLRLDDAVKVILEEEPDILGVQESDFAWTAYLNAGLSKVYKCVSIGRDNGKSLGEAAAIYYKAERFELLDYDYFWLSETPDEPSYGWDAGCRRICTWALFYDKVLDKKFVHVNTHLDFTPIANVKGLEMVLDFMKTLKYPAVLTGDFNFGEDQSQHQQVLDAGLFDSKFIAKETMNGATYYNYEEFDPDGYPIDFLYVTSGVTVSKYQIVTNTNKCSDHFPVYIEMNFE